MSEKIAGGIFHTYEQAALDAGDYLEGHDPEQENGHSPARKNYFYKEGVVLGFEFEHLITKHLRDFPEPDLDTVLKAIDFARGVIETTFRNRDLIRAACEVSHD
jgi:hypothetical protein